MAKILIIDDSKFLCALLRDTLEKAGYRASAVHTIIEAAKYLKADTPDVILLDINLPGTIQGNEACRMLKSSPSCKNVPIILMSGATADEMEKKQLECGADGFLVKPFTPPQVIEWLVSRIPAFARPAAG